MVSVVRLDDTPETFMTEKDTRKRLSEGWRPTVSVVRPEDPPENLYDRKRLSEGWRPVVSPEDPRETFMTEKDT